MQYAIVQFHNEIQSPSEWNEASQILYECNFAAKFYTGYWIKKKLQHPQRRFTEWDYMVHSNNRTIIWMGGYTTADQYEKQMGSAEESKDLASNRNIGLHRINYMFNWDSTWDIDQNTFMH